MRVRRRNRAGTAVEHGRQRGARRVVQRRQYELACSGEHPRFGMARGRWDRSGLRYELVDGDAEPVPGVELVETGGHVPGHQSVLVRLPETGPVLLAIDAIPAADALDPDARAIAPFDMDVEEAPASTRKLVGFAEREGVRLIVRGHDAEQWRRLRLLPRLLLVTPEGTPKRGGVRL